MQNGFIAVAKKGNANFKAVLPSKNCRLYFMFDEEFNRATIQELITKRKAVKMTAYDLYKLVLEEQEFVKSLEAYKNLKFKGELSV